MRRKTIKEEIHKRIKMGFRVGDKIIVNNDNPDDVKNVSIIYKSGKVIGISKFVKDNICVQFDEEIIGGHSGNSLRFFGIPFRCFWVNSACVIMYDEEVKKSIEKQKEIRAQRVEDEWYDKESYI